MFSFIIFGWINPHCLRFFLMWLNYVFFYKIHVFFECFYIPPDESGIIFELTNFGLRFWAVTSTPKTSNKGLLSLSNASRDFDVISQMASV